VYADPLESGCAIFLGMRLRFGLLLPFLAALWRPCLAQDAPSSSDSGKPPAVGETASSPSPDTLSPNVFPERPVSWLKLVPNLAHDQKDIWLFPVALARGRHLKPVFVLTAVTAGVVASVDVSSGRYFQRTRSFDGFNRAFSGSNTSIAMFALPIAFYGINLARKDAYAQHTFLLTGEAVLGSEILTSVMKDVDRRMKPSEVPPNGNFSDTWFRSHAGDIVRGIGSFPSGHTISAFSLVTIFADRYPRPRWRTGIAYGLAAAVGFSRVSLQSHHPSDVFAGAVLGYATAHYGVLQARN
jgi:hypothetical protein